MNYITHENTTIRYQIPYLPNRLPRLNFFDYNVTLGELEKKVALHKMFRIIGEPGCGKTTLLIAYAKKNQNAIFIGLGGHASPKDILVKLATTIGLPFKLSDDVATMLEMLKHKLSERPRTVFLIDEADNLCPNSSKSQLPTLRAIRHIYDYTNIPFVFAATYEMEVRIQRSDKKHSTSQFYRRCAVHEMKGMNRAEALSYLELVEKDFPIVIEAPAKKTLVDRLCDSQRAGLSTVVEILESCFAILLEKWKEFDTQISGDIPREEALKLFADTPPVNLNNDMVLSAMEGNK